MQAQVMKKIYDTEFAEVYAQQSHSAGGKISHRQL